MTKTVYYQVEIHHWEWFDAYGKEVIEIEFTDGFLTKIYWKVENYHHYYSFEHTIHVFKRSAKHHIKVTTDTQAGLGVKTIELELEHYEHMDRILDQFLNLLCKRIKFF